MTLVLTLAAAAAATLVWYAQLPNKTYHVGVLALMYWGATLMWCVDGIASLIEGGPFIEIYDQAAIFDDTLLGLVVVVAGFAAWVIYLLIRDPKQALAKALQK